MRIALGIPPSAGASLARRLAWLIGARLLFLTLLLAVLVLFYGRQGQLNIESFTVKGATLTLAVAYAMAGAYAAVLRAGRHTRMLADVQLVLDQLTWTVIVYLSGGASSGATSFYGLTCLSGAVLTGMRGASLAAVGAMAFYVPTVFGIAIGWLPVPPDQPVRLYLLPAADLAYHVLINLLVLVVVTLLSGYLAERLRLTGGRLERAEERAKRAEHMALLGRLAAGLAHEIRNPLGSIAGSMQILKGSSELSLEDRQLCDIVLREASRLDDMVTDMMQLTRPRKPAFVPVDVAALARDVVQLASGSGRAVSDVGVAYSGTDQATVMADGDQLRQLVWNLVRNGVQASRAGDVVRVAVDRDANHVVLTVEDDGIGIDAEAREQLFDAFFTTRSQGTGVGLAVVKRIADDHGFEIVVESEKGQGASFRVRMPHGVELNENLEGSARGSLLPYFGGKQTNRP
jgi:two-component system sensor histidine kinase HydH